MKKNKVIPRLSTPIIETHCHLDYLKELPLDTLLSKCIENNIEKIITIAVEPDNFQQVLKLINENEFIYGTQGVHPHQAITYNNNVKDEIIKNSKHKKVLAIGEIGLDYHYNKSPKDKQIEAFEAQLELACAENLPVVIHSRDAEDDTITILEKFAPRLLQKGVIHSFTSEIRLAKKAIELGFYLGFNGIITFKNAENVRAALKITPLSKLLLETDSPYLTPVPFRGKENAPYYLPCVAQYMADFLNHDCEELLKQIHQNSMSLFKF
ncbi:MAG: TatD family hydrolase [Bacteriovoracaceae bacterium]|nr:TatD family hydrolase [Bacteriovoracaceae bacterium]